MDLPGYNCLQIQATHGRLLVEAEVEPPLEQTSSIQLPGGQKLTCVEPTSILTLREKVIVPIATEKMEKGPPLPHGVYHLEGNNVYFAHWENGHIVVSQHVFLPAHRWQDSALQFVKQITEPDCSRNSPRVVGIRAWESGMWIVTASQPSESTPFSFSKFRLLDVHTLRFPAEPRNRAELPTADFLRLIQTTIPPAHTSREDRSPDRTELRTLLLPSAATPSAGPPLVRVVVDDDDNTGATGDVFCAPGIPSEEDGYGAPGMASADQSYGETAPAIAAEAPAGARADGNVALLEEVRLLRLELRTLTSSFSSFQQDFSRLVDHFTSTHRANSIN
eukprot:GEMP01042699.1.p1 GENE.GEMP01042699.1~~GEMP01042699.1.p1  ORF type:complete len:334 (+),score=74.34 GEMP01042699.1:412-1413(+)